MFEAFFTDSCLRYRIEVINGIDFYGLGFGMVRGESMGKWISQWMQKGETASVLITNTKLPDTSGFEFAERIRSQCPRDFRDGYPELCRSAAGCALRCICVPAEI